jgi:phosphoribosylanthranilate isomerase
MTQIKICGITNIEDALCAAACGADAVGFIFHPASPRYIAPERAKAIIAELPEELTKVGIFVNREAKEVVQIADHCGLDIIQLHGDESPEYCRSFDALTMSQRRATTDPGFERGDSIGVRNGRYAMDSRFRGNDIQQPAFYGSRRFAPERIIKAVFPQTVEDLPALDAYNVRALLVDCREGNLYGGTGKRADWGLAARFAQSRPVILAGGLDIGNIGEALAAVAPDAVDINSGIESAPGVKDHDRMRRIIEIVRRAGQSGQRVVFEK